MKNECRAPAAAVALIVIVFIMILAMHLYTWNVRFEDGYKEACKDCAEGKLKYELKEIPGGERLWVKKQ